MDFLAGEHLEKDGIDLQVLVVDEAVRVLSKDAESDMAERVEKKAGVGKGSKSVFVGSIGNRGAVIALVIKDELGPQTHVPIDLRGDR